MEVLTGMHATSPAISPKALLRDDEKCPYSVNGEVGALYLLKGLKKEQLIIYFHSKNAIP